MGTVRRGEGWVIMAQWTGSARGRGGSENGPIPVKEQKMGSVEKMGLCPYVHLNLHMKKPVLAC